MKLSKTLRRIQRPLILVGIIALSPQVQAQLCSRNDTPETISTSNYDLEQPAAGELTDTTNQLIWRRCLYGQQWDSTLQTCTGTPTKVNWQTALRVAQGTGWRLPNVKELLSIIDLQCFAPPLHPELFPEAPASLSSGLWTSTPNQTNISNTDVFSHAWLVDLGHGKLRHQSTNQLNFVIFVKNP